MRKIAATYILTGEHPPIKNGILVSEPDGTIVDIINNNGELREEAGLEFYSGILVPGFINTHCRLELSHLKGRIEKHSGIENFLEKRNKLRDKECDNKEKTFQLVDRKMWASGIAAIGDISKSTDTLTTKLKSKIQYHTFVESFGSHPSQVEKSFETTQNIYSEFVENKLSVSIVPHSSYSVSYQLLEKIKENALTQKNLLSLNNQESKSETHLNKNAAGTIADDLHNNLKFDNSHWHPIGENSLASVLMYLPAEDQLLLIHNTYTESSDLSELKKRRSLNNTYFVLCPNSNIYIEKKLPPVSLFREEKLNICLGTDSQTSNDQLSILAEMITLQNYFPELKLEELIQWGTLNGAKALQIEKDFGSFQKGKKPGINLITGVDLKNMRLTENCRVKRLA